MSDVIEGWPTPTVEWPRVTPNDDGIRPAGGEDECFYCASRVGERHLKTCVTILKRVRVRYVYEIEIDVPHGWEGYDVEFNRNDGSWCATNGIGDIEDYAKTKTPADPDDPDDDPEPGCLCKDFRCEFVGVVDETPRKRPDRE